MQTTRRLCLCEDRCDARDAGRFTYSALRGGWTFTHGPIRCMSAAARYHAMIDRTEYPHTDHSGEPFCWECCPWCGGDLPMTQPFWGAQADGEVTE